MNDDSNRLAREAAAALKERIASLDDDALDLLFREARTHRAWQKRPLSDELLRRLYALMRMGPTSGNCCPARLLFLRTAEAKERLRPALDEGNVGKTLSAPVTVIIGYDVEFWRHLKKLNPVKDMSGPFRDNPKAAQSAAFRNGSLQGAYLMLAARALGLDCGPMSGFSAAKVNAEFFAGTAVKANFLCNLGYGDPQRLHPRLPRFEFDEVCQLL